VWPNPKLLLNIVKKMYRQRNITAEEKGILKERILRKDPVLEEALSKYEQDGEQENLFMNIKSCMQHY
jgi:hypothetical protein